MTRIKSQVLTDVAHDVWLDTFTLTNDNLRLATPHAWSLRKRTLRGGLRDGVEVLDVSNGALSFTVLPTRGMGLWRGDYRGMFLGWRAPVQGPVHPKFVDLDDRNGLGWLLGFDELLCRCGLSSNGPPGEDVVTSKDGQTSRMPLTLHGRIANRPAHYLEVKVSLDPPHEISVTGVVEEGGLFYPHLALTTTYTTIPGSNRLVIHDVVENRGARPAEMEMLYHLNVGAPFLEAGSRVLAPVKELAPLTPRAAEGIDTYDTYGPPTVGFAEQVYCYDLATEEHGKTLVMLTNAAAERALVVRLNRQELPCFTLWRNTAAVEEGYVTGLEPGTNYPNFKSFERKNGRVPTLAPGGRWQCTWSIEVVDTAPAVTAVLKEIVTAQSHTKPQLHRTPQAKFSPM